MVQEKYQPCHGVGAQGGDLAAHTYAAARAWKLFVIDSILSIVSILSKNPNYDVCQVCVYRK